MRNSTWFAAAVAGIAVATACAERKHPVDEPIPGASAEERYLDAVRKLDVDRSPDAAAVEFRAIADDAGASAGVRARALVGLARADRLLGRGEDAETRLREALAKSADLPSIAAEAQAELTSLAGTRTRFATGIVELGEAQFLDLDTGGVFGTPDTPLGGRAEIARRGDNVVYLAQHDEAPEMNGALPWIADAPWWRVATDGGRAAWVQRLSSDRAPVLRFVVRLSGMGAPLAAPMSPFCIVKDAAIDVFFGTDRKYVRYRIERRVGLDGIFEEKEATALPPFVDRDVKPDVRYGYRITGITAEGDEGLPALVQGTTKSRGVVAGSVDLVGGRGDLWFDFLTQSVVAGGGDLAFHNAYGNFDAVGFLDGHGRVVRASREGGPPRTSFASAAKRDWPQEIRTGDWFLVPIRGGGVARCRVTIPHKSWQVRLDYEVDPDADSFGEGPTLNIEERPTDAVLHVAIPLRGFTVPRVTARDPRTPGQADELVVADGRAVDPKAGPNALREYVAAGVDQFGRRSSAATATLNRLPSTPVEGTFEFHYQQGYSFERGMVCDAADADVVFASCAGGISSITLSAPGGIASLEGALGRDDAAPPAGRLFAQVYAADEKTLRLRPSVECDDRSPRSDVVVLRTRHGGWARVAIIRRDEQGKGGWTEEPATLRFAYNPRSPVFNSSNDAAAAHGGIRIGPRPTPPGGRSSKPVDGTFQFHYRQAYSFARAAVCEPDDDDADVVFQTCAGGISSITLRAPAGIASLETAVGRDDRETPSAGRLFEMVLGAEEGTLKLGRDVDCDERSPASDVAVLQTADGGWARVAIVLRVDQGDWQKAPATVRFTYNAAAPEFAESAETPDVVAGFRLAPGARAARPREPQRGPSTGPVATSAKETRERLASRKAGVAIAKNSFAKTVGFVRDLGFRVEIDPAVVAGEVEFTSKSPVTIAELLDTLTAQAGVAWTVTDAGVVRIVPAKSAVDAATTTAAKATFEAVLDDAKALAATRVDPVKAAERFGDAVALAQAAGDLKAEQAALDALVELVDGAERDALAKPSAEGTKDGPPWRASLVAAVMQKLDPTRCGALVSAPVLARNILLLATDTGDFSFVDLAARVAVANAARPTSGRGAVVTAKYAEGLTSVADGQFAAAAASLDAAAADAGKEGWIDLAERAATEAAAAWIRAGEADKAAKSLGAAAACFGDRMDPWGLREWKSLVGRRLGDAPASVRKPVDDLVAQESGPPATRRDGNQGGNRPGTDMPSVWSTLPAAAPVVAATRNERSFVVRWVTNPDEERITDRGAGVWYSDAGGLTLGFCGRSVGLCVFGSLGRGGFGGRRSPSLARAFYLLAEGETWSMSKDGIVTIVR